MSAHPASRSNDSCVDGGSVTSAHLAEEFGRRGDGAVDERSEILERNAIPDPPELVAQTPMRCGSDEPCTTAVTSGFC